MSPTKNAGVVFAALYLAVFCNTLLLHSVFSRPYRQLRGPAGHLSDKKERATAAKVVGGKRTRNGASVAAHAELQPSQEEVVDGDTISSILRGDVPFPNSTVASRLRFEPGTLNLSQPATLRHCYADPSVYELHFPLSDRQVTSVSDHYRLVYLMLPKSGSSTGRWVMDNVLSARDIPMDPAGDALATRYREYDVITFVRDPLSRFYSQFDEVFMRYAPWMKQKAGRAWQGLKRFQHPYPWLYDNMTEWVDYQNAFCPPETIPDEVDGPAQWWCSMQQTRENGTLAARFARFVEEYDGVTPWDIHLHLQVPHISNKHTGRARRVNEIYNTATTIKDWQYIVHWYGQSLPEDGKMNARSVPRRFNVDLVSDETKRLICKMSAIDYCCLNLRLPTECREVGVHCSLDVNTRGAFRIQPWLHPHEIHTVG